MSKYMLNTIYASIKQNIARKYNFGYGLIILLFRPSHSVIRKLSALVRELSLSWSTTNITTNALPKEYIVKTEDL